MARPPGPRRAGSRGVPRAQREQQILLEAGRAFAARGYHAASMDEIAAAADVSKPMLYAYFSSKEGLYFAYIERMAKELMARVFGAASAPGLPSMERVDAGIDEFFRFVCEHRDAWAVFQAEAASRGGPLAGQVMALRADIAAQIADGLGGLAAERERRDVPVHELDALAHALVGGGESLATWSLERPEEQRASAAARLKDLARGGLAAVLGRPGRITPR